MDSSSSSHRCPGCQRPLEPGRALGLCPRCLLARAAFATEAEAAGSTPAVPELATVAAAFPQLEILELIGRGGMGVVYRARQKSLNRLVALKLLAPGRERDPAFAERFAREAHALAALNHPNIVTVHDFGFATSESVGEAGGFYFLLMEFVDGVNLRQAMHAGRFTPEQALAIVPPVCVALQFAHERGIVHRDIKPENLLLDKDGRIKIADFGIAKMLGAPASDPASGNETAADGGSAPGRRSALREEPTRATAAGTPQYMAPEQHDQSGRSDHRADIYSLGVVLYELLTGELPGARLEPPSHKVQIDVRLDEIVLRALKANPELRYQTAGEFRTELETMVSTPVGNMPEAAKAGTPSPRQLRSSRCYITTGEHMDSWWRKYIYMYSGQGRLTLDSDQLAFVGTFGDTVIPLGAIRDIRIGEYPRFMKPHGLNFIRVTFEGGGRTRSLCFIPNEGPWEPTWDTNAVVAEWFTAIREAMSAAVAQPRTPTPAEKPAGRVFPEIPQLLRTSNGLLHTPEQLGTFEGQFCVWRHRGQLLLDDRQLVHSRDGVQTVIPLTAIRDISIAQYPRTMNPVGVDFLSVTYEDAGQTKRVCLAPMGGWFAWPSTWNARVADWAAAVRHAVASATGREPVCTPREQLPPVGSRRSVLALMSLLYLLPMIAVFLFLILRPGSTRPDSTVFYLVSAVALMVGGFLGTMRMMRRGPAASCKGSTRVWGVALVLLALAAGMASLERQVRQRRVEAVAQQAALLANRNSEAAANVRKDQLAARLVNATDPAERRRLEREQIQIEVAQRTAEMHAAGLELALNRTRGFNATVLLPAVPLLLAGLWLALRRQPPSAREAPVRRWMQWLGGGCLVLGVPLAALAGWIWILISQDSAWNPGFWEAVTVALVTLGSVVLLGGGFWLLASAHPGRRGGAGALVLALLAAALSAFLFLAISLLPNPIGLAGKPPQASLTFEPVRLDDNVIVAKLRSSVAGGSVELRAGLSGPALPETVLADLPRRFRELPVSLARSGVPKANRAWQLHAAGSNVWQVGFVFPTAAAAEETFRALATQELGEMDSGGVDLFETIASDGQRYRGELFLGPPVNASDAGWMSVTGRSSFKESSVTLDWEVAAGSGGLLHGAFGTTVSTMSLNAPYRTRGNTLRMELTRLSDHEARLRTTLLGTGSEQVVSGDFDDLADELLGSACFSAKGTRGEEFELCRFNGNPFTVQLLQNPTTMSDRPKLAFWPVLALLLLVGLAVLTAIVAVLAVRRRWGGAIAVVLLVVAGLMLLSVVLTATFYARTGGRASPAAPAVMPSAVRQ